MTKSPLISVIIPVYNVEKYLRECLDSVLAQTYKNLEIILIDDGSSDNSGQICDEYAAKDSRIKVIHQVNQGVSAARNAGLKAARGQYIGFVDSDDYIKPDMYEYLYQLISKDNADVAMCNFYKGSFRTSSKDILDNYKLQKLLNIFDVPSWIFLWNKLYKSTLIQGISFRSDMTYGEDSFFVFEIAKQNGLLAIGQEIKYFYRNNPTSCSRNFTKLHLKSFTAVDMMVSFAAQHNLHKLYLQTRTQNLRSASSWLALIALSETPDLQSVYYLTKYVRKHWTEFYLLCQTSLLSKCFVSLCCINFPLASKIYQLLKGNR